MHKPTQPRSKNWEEKLDKVLRERGLVLVRLLEEPIKSVSKLIVRCEKDGYEWQTHYNRISFRPTNGCRRCSESRGKFNKKTPQAEVEIHIRERGFSIPPGFTYTTAHAPMTIICVTHGEITMTWANFKKGADCLQCSLTKASAQKIQASNWDEKLKQLLISRKLDLVEKLEEPLSSASKIKVRCQEDLHEWVTSYNWLSNQKRGCPKCAGILNLTSEKIKTAIKENGFILLSDLPQTLNNTVRFELCCKEGHDYSTNWNKFSPKFSCPYCSKALIHPKDFKKRLASLGFETTDQYQDVDTPLNLTCLKGHVIEKSYRSIWLDKAKCPQCTPPYSSKDEDEVATWLKTILPENSILRNNRTLLKGHEIDILIPDKKIGIELSGLYYHNEIALLSRGMTTGEARSYHQSKHIRALKEGVQLVTIWDYEWKFHQAGVKSRLKALLGLNQIRYGARELEVRKIPKIDFPKIHNFLDEHHVQGHALFKYAYGLFREDELLSVMTFQTPHRQNVMELTLNRYCVKYDHTLAGGAKKLFEFARKDLNRSIISYSDNRWSNGNIYEVLGFKRTRISPPDYFYANTSSRLRPYFSKQSQKKTPAERLTGKTERELRLEQGLTRVWDCGKITWLYEHKLPE